jgi:hypothetical protein
MNADILITIVFVAWAVVTAGFSGMLIVRSGFGPRHDGRN